MNAPINNGNPLNATKILELIGALTRRPGPREARKGGKRRGLPLLCLVWRQSTSPGGAAPPSIDDRYSLLEAVELYLGESTPSDIPAALITLPYIETMAGPPRQLPPAEREDVDAVRAILRQCADQLAGRRGAQGAIRYPLFQIVDALMGPLPGETEQEPNRRDRRGELRRQLSDQWWRQHPALRKAIGATKKVTDAASAAVSPPLDPAAGLACLYCSQGAWRN